MRSKVDSIEFYWGILIRKCHSQYFRLNFADWPQSTVRNFFDFFSQSKVLSLFEISMQSDQSQYQSD